MKDFPDWFFDKADWQEKTLGEIAEKIIGGGTPDTTNKNFYEGNITWISSSDLTENDVHKISKTRFITEDAIKNSATKKIPPKAILIVTRVGVGKVALADEILCTSQDFTNFILKENFLPEFFVYQIAIKMKIAAQQTQGTAIKGTTTDEVKKIKLKFPPIETQKKIADYFTHLDNAINAQEIKLQSWRDAKKALLQKIFSQEFYFTQDNGEKYPAWQEKTLGDFLEVHTEKNLNRSFDRNKVLSVSGEKGIVNQIEFQGRSFAGADLKEYKIVHKGDIVYTKSPLKNSPYGIFKVNRGEIGIVSTLYAVYRAKNNNSAEFVEYYFADELRLNKYLKPIVNIGAKHDMKISNENVLIGKVFFPSPEEQKKIADYFSSLDRIIDAENKMLESLRLMKKGLLQKLFV